MIWNKVYDLADFVYFHHARHTAAGLDCRSCHSAVETMKTVEKVSSLTMGWWSQDFICRRASMRLLPR
ncbi:MAG: cytochrome c3 family protein [Candidatus Sumerlaeota bacterium]|nr:cytochrome c3 family protein [Candidatus Sumerlaeota bacterium]